MGLLGVISALGTTFHGQWSSPRYPGRVKGEAVIVRTRPLLCFAVARAALGLLALAPLVHAADPDKLLEKADRLAWLKNWPEAGPLYTDAERLYEEQGDTRNALYAKIGRLRSQVGSMSYLEASDYLGSLLESPVVQSDPELRLHCLTAKAEFDIASRPPSESRPLWEEVRELAGELGDEGWEARASGELGIISFLEGDSASALTLVGEALKSAMATGDIGSQIRYMGLIGRALAQFGRHDTALEYFKRAILLAENTPGAGYPYIAVIGRGEALLALGKLSEARKVFEAALENAAGSRALGYQVELLTQLGALHGANGNRQLGIEYLEKAANSAVEGQLDRLTARAMLELAKLYRESGDVEKAEEYAAIGAQARMAIGEVYTHAADLAVQADLKAAEGDFDKADALYARATDIVDGMLVNVPTLDARSSLLAAKSDIYVKHFTLAIEKLQDLPKGFHVVEQARGRSAADGLRTRPLELTGEPGERSPADAKIARLQMDLRRSEDPRQRTALLDEIFEVEQELKLEGAVVMGGGVPVELHELQDVLGEDELVLEYVLSEPASYCLVIDRDDVGVVRLNGRRQIEGKVEQYLSAVRSMKVNRSLAEDVFRELLAPVMSRLEEKSRLIVVPDGSLHWLPFGSLVGPDAAYLVQSHVVTAAPSGTVLHLLRTSQRDERPTLPLLAVGNVQYGSNRIAQTRGLYDVEGEKFGALPSTLKEVSEATTIAGAKSVLLVGGRATEASFKAQPLSTFRVLHLALHGVASTQYPERAALVFGPDTASVEDGLLQAREIGRLRLGTDLVILSACNTGIGRLEGQDGVANLVRAFLFAGAKSVVASQWAADDVATAALMKRFYTRLAEGLDRGSALRSAKLDLIETHGTEIAPYYWAGFTLVGEGSTPTDFTQ